MSGAKQRVLDALAKKLMTNNARKLRVGDLLREANINRSTFYYHFRSLDDAYDRLINDGLAPIDKYLAPSYGIASQASPTELFEAQRSFFEYCMDHGNLYHALLWGDLRERFLSDFINRIELLLTKKYRTRLADSLPGRDVTDDAAYNMLFYRSIAYQQFSILETWVAQDFEQAPELVAKMACLIIQPSPDLYSVEAKRTAQSRGA